MQEKLTARRAELIAFACPNPPESEKGISAQPANVRKDIQELQPSTKEGTKGNIPVIHDSKWILACMLQIAVVATPNNLATAAEELSDSVLDASSMEKAGIESIRIEWSATATIPAGAYGSPNQWLPSLDKLADKIPEETLKSLQYQDQQPNPPHELTLRSHGVFIMDGESMSSVEFAELWNQQKQDIGELRPERSVFHEGEYRSHLPSRSTGNIQGYNLLGAGKAQDIFLIPFTLEKQLRDSRVAQLGQIQLKGRPILIVGNVDYNDNPSARGATRFEWYLDMEEDYLPLHFKRMLPDGTIRSEFTYTYGRQGPARRFPMIAERTIYQGEDPEKVRSYTKWTIDSIEINPVVDPEVFELKFPPGTQVYDGTHKVNFQIGAANPLEEWAKAPTFDDEGNRVPLPDIPEDRVASITAEVEGAGSSSGQSTRRSRPERTPSPPEAEAEPVEPPTSNRNMLIGTLLLCVAAGAAIFYLIRQR